MARLTPCHRTALAGALLTAALVVQAQPAPPGTDAPGASPCDATPPALPPRPPGAPSGSAFARSLDGLDEPAREQAVRTQLLAGNLPDFLRAWQPVRWQATLPGGAPVQLTLCVLADYLAVGRDGDFLRVPMGLATAQALMARFGGTLPTRHIVDRIYRQAAVQLAPQPLPAGDAMRSTGYLVRHNALVQQQRDAAAAPPQALTAGHKKDLVLSPRLWLQPGRLALYGWHRAPGAPIQPLSLVHGARYADYSHGVRLVGATVFVDGRPQPLAALLADARLAALLSDEGPLPGAAALLAAAPPPPNAAGE